MSSVYMCFIVTLKDVSKMDVVPDIIAQHILKCCGDDLKLFLI